MFELRVLSGLHLGAALPLTGENWLIGHTEEADLYLDDTGINTSQWRLVRTDENWFIVSLEDDNALPVRVGDAFPVGGVWLCVAEGNAPWTSFIPPASVVTQNPSEEKACETHTTNTMKGILPRSIYVLSFSLLLLLSLTLASLFLQPTVAQTSEVNSGRQYLDNVAKIRSQLMAMLRERDLASVITVTASEKKVLLNGIISKEQMQVFTRMLSRFNEKYITAFTLENKVTLRTTKLPFRIVQVTTGKHANIVTEEGQRLFIGDQFKGMRLEAITDDRIIFSGSENIKVGW